MTTIERPEHRDTRPDSGTPRRSRMAIPVIGRLANALILGLVAPSARSARAMVRISSAVFTSWSGSTRMADAQDVDKRIGRLIHQSIVSNQ